VQLEDFILSFPTQLTPIRSVAERLAGSDSLVFEGGVEFSHRPKIGSQAYALTLFKPLGQAVVERYESIHDFSVSPHYACLLSSFNGACAFQLSLYGIPPSMADDQPRLNRSANQPHDLATANRFWKQEYGVPPDWFHFGGGPLSHDENVGYFFDALGTVHSVRKDRSVIASWPNFSRFLYDELTRCEAMYSDFESSMAVAIQATRRSWLNRLFSRRGTSA
jgi:hypothetical protein